MDETTLVVAVITAATGLMGVALGGWISYSNQRDERRRAFLRAQLDDFYAPMVGLRMRILARSQSRQKVSEAADRASQRRLEGKSVEAQRRLEEWHGAREDQMIEYDNRMLFEELLPMYREMVDVFSKRIGLAEPSTQAHFGELVHYVDVWNRSEKKVLPFDVTRELGHSESKLKPLYDDLASNVARLQGLLKK